MVENLCLTRTVCRMIENEQATGGLPRPRLTSPDDVLTAPERSRRWAGLDGLRALAVGVVVACHFGLHANGGFVGVDVFFVISGFLITSLLLDEREKTGRISFRNFWARRALRLFPALGCAIAFALLMSIAAFPHERHLTVTAVPAVLLYLGNWWIAFGPGGHSLGLLDHCWSLAVEEQFYILWPLLAAAWMAQTRNRGRASIIVGALSIADCAWAVFASRTLNISYGYFRSDTHAMGLLAGSALALFVLSKRDIELSKKTAALLRIAAAVAVATILGITLVVRQSMSTQGIASIVATLASTVLVTQLVLAPSGLLTNIFEHPIVTWFGRRSYGIYLFNYPLAVVLLQHAQKHNLHRLELTTLGVFATIAISAASYRWVEQPFLRRKARFTISRTLEHIP
jgi:peptidoglycan/LPS O-acetylase OafA/YrhL